MDTQLRSIVKSISWRIIAVLNGIFITFLFTHDLSKSIAIGVSANITGFVLYYIHERGWNKIKWGQEFENSVRRV